MLGRHLGAVEKDPLGPLAASPTRWDDSGFCGLLLSISSLSVSISCSWASSDLGAFHWNAPIASSHGQVSFHGMPEMPQRGNCCMFYFAAIRLEAHRGLIQIYHTGKNTLVTKALLATVPKYLLAQIISVEVLVYLWLGSCVVLCLGQGLSPFVRSFNSLTWRCLTVYLHFHSSVGEGGVSWRSVTIHNCPLYIFRLTFEA